jgi:hypothetical protein
MVEGGTTAPLKAVVWASPIGVGRLTSRSAFFCCRRMRRSCSYRKMSSTCQGPEQRLSDEMTDRFWADPTHSSAVHQNQNS